MVRMFFHPLPLLFYILPVSLLQLFLSLPNFLPALVFLFMMLLDLISPFFIKLIPTLLIFLLLLSRMLGVFSFPPAFLFAGVADRRTGREHQRHHERR